MLGFTEAVVRIFPTDHPEIALLAQLAFIPSLWKSGDLFVLNGVQWSLWFELFINLLHGLAAKMLSSRNLVIILAVSSIGLIVTSVEYKGLGVGWARENFVGGFSRVVFSYCSGIFIFRCDQRNVLPRVVIPWQILALTLPVAVITARLVGYSNSPYSALVIVMVVFPLMIVAALSVHLPPRIAATASWLGGVSYPLYALQGVISKVVKFLIHPYALNLPERLAIWSISGVATVLISRAALVWFDEPVRRLLRTQFESRPRRTELRDG